MKLRTSLIYVALGGLFLIPLFPLLVANSFFFPFITAKAFYFRIIVEIVFSTWVVLAFLEPKYRPRLTPLGIAVTLFAIVALIADLLGVNPVRSILSNFERMEGWLTIAHLWMFFIAASSMLGSGEEGKRMWRRWFSFSLAVATIVGIYGLFQLFGAAAIHQGSTRLDASLGNSAYLAVYMLIHAFMAAYLFFETRVRGKQPAAAWLCAVLAVFFSFILFETQTRGTILGLIGGILLALGLYAVFAKGRPAKGRWISAGIIGAIVLLGVIFWLDRGAAFIQRSPTLARLATISWEDTQTQARAYIWPMALKGAAQRPIFGWGQENFNYIFNANYNPLMWNQEQWFDRAHSVYLDWLTASGGVGLAVYLSLYVLLFAAIWKSQLSAAEKSVLSGAVAGYAIHNVFVFDNLASYVFFFAILAFASTFKQGKPIRFIGTAPLRSDAVEYIVAPIMILLLAAGLYFLNVRPIQANTGLITALGACGQPNGADPQLFQNVLSIGAPVAQQETREQILSCAGDVVPSTTYPGPVKQAFFNLASSAIADQIATAPNDARMYVLGGSFMDTISRFGDADPLLEKAHALSPGKQSIDLALAQSYVNIGKKDQAVDLLHQAYLSAPADTSIRDAYISVLIIDGKEDQARAEFSNDPTIFDTDPMAQLFASLKEYPKAIAIYQRLIAVASSTDINLRAALAQVQYVAGMNSQAVATLRSIEKDHPEYKDQIEADIKQIQP